MKKILALALALLLAVPAWAGQIKVGEKAPEFTYANLDGKKVSLSDYSGKVVVLGFVDTCPPCRDQAQELEKVRQKYEKNPQVAVLSIIFEDQKGTRELLEQMKPKAQYPLLLDPQMSISKSYGIWGDPQVAVVDKKGNITFKNYITAASDLAREVDKALK